MCTLNEGLAQLQIRQLIHPEAVGSTLIARLCASVAVRSSGRRVSYMPPGLRKSGMPAETLTPAPVRKATDLERAMTSAIFWIVAARIRGMSAERVMRKLRAREKADAEMAAARSLGSLRAQTWLLTNHSQRLVAAHHDGA